MFTEKECVLLKRARILWAFSMRVAAISVLCSSPDGVFFEALERSGTPCPINGLIGEEAQAYWDANPHEKPHFKGKPEVKEWSDDDKATAVGAGGIIGLFVLLLLFI